MKHTFFIVTLLGFFLFFTAPGCAQITQEQLQEIQTNAEKGDAQAQFNLAIKQV